MKKLKEKLNAKLSKNGGFTLVEMLIVVAIIAILVAVSIPLVGSALEKAKEATDDANLRAAKAEAVIMYMNHQIDSTATAPAVDMVYDNVAGKFVTKAVDDVAGTKVKGYGKTTAHENKRIKITAVNDGTPANVNSDIVTVAWET